MSRLFKSTLGASFVVALAGAILAPAAVLAVAVPPFLSASFSPATINVGSTSTLTFSINNDETNPALTGLNFTDTLPAGLTVANGTAGGCSGTVTTTAPSTIAFAGGSLPAGWVCQFSVTVTGATAGDYTNVTGPIGSNQTGSGGAASAALTVNALPSPPTIQMAFGASTLAIGDSMGVKFLITNPNSSASLSGIAFTDNLPIGLIISAPNDLSNMCGGSASATAYGSVISLSGVSLAAASSCGLSLSVTAASPGVQTNTTSAITSTEGGTGLTATATVTVGTPFTIGTTFNPSALPANGTTTLSFGIYNPETAETDLTGVAFTATLPAGFSAANGSATICSDDSGTATITGGDTIAVTGVNLPIGWICTFSVTVTTSVPDGTYKVVAGWATSNEGVPGAGAAAFLVIGDQATLPPSTTAMPSMPGNSDPQPLLLLAALIGVLAAARVATIRRRIGRES
jgi:uncharacterized repeat protein (TIGR01451 family)